MENNLIVDMFSILCDQDSDEAATDLSQYLTLLKLLKLSFCEFINVHTTKKVKRRQHFQVASLCMLKLQSLLQHPGAYTTVEPEPSVRQSLLDAVRPAFNPSEGILMLLMKAGFTIYEDSLRATEDVNSASEVESGPQSLNEFQYLPFSTDDEPEVSTPTTKEPTQSEHLECINRFIIALSASFLAKFIHRPHGEDGSTDVFDVSLILKSLISPSHEMRNIGNSVADFLLKVRRDCGYSKIFALSASDIEFFRANNCNGKAIPCIVADCVDQIPPVSALELVRSSFSSCLFSLGNAYIVGMLWAKLDEKGKAETILLLKDRIEKASFQEDNEHADSFSVLVWLCEGLSTDCGDMVIGGDVEEGFGIALKSYLLKRSECCARPFEAVALPPFTAPWKPREPKDERFRALGEGVFNLLCGVLFECDCRIPRLVIHCIRFLLLFLDDSDHFQVTTVGSKYLWECLEMASEVSRSISSETAGSLLLVAGINAVSLHRTILEYVSDRNITESVRCAPLLQLTSIMLHWVLDALDVIHEMDEAVKTVLTTAIINCAGLSFQVARLISVHQAARRLRRRTPSELEFLSACVGAGVDPSCVFKDDCRKESADLIDSPSPCTCLYFETTLELNVDVLGYHEDSVPASVASVVALLVHVSGSPYLKEHDEEEALALFKCSIFSMIDADHANLRSVHVKEDHLQRTRFTLFMELLRSGTAFVNQGGPIGNVSSILKAAVQSSLEILNSEDIQGSHDQYQMLTEMILEIVPLNVSEFMQLLGDALGRAETISETKLCCLLNAIANASFNSSHYLANINAEKGLFIRELTKVIKRACEKTEGLDISLPSELILASSINLLRFVLTCATSSAVQNCPEDAPELLFGMASDLAAVAGKEGTSMLVSHCLAILASFAQGKHLVLESSGDESDINTVTFLVRLKVLFCSLGELYSRVVGKGCSTVTRNMIETALSPSADFVRSIATAYPPVMTANPEKEFGRYLLGLHSSDTNLKEKCNVIVPLQAYRPPAEPAPVVLEKTSRNEAPRKSHEKTWSESTLSALYAFSLDDAFVENAQELDNESLCELQSLTPRVLGQLSDLLRQYALLHATQRVRWLVNSRSWEIEAATLAIKEKSVFIKSSVDMRSDIGDSRRRSLAANSLCGFTAFAEGQNVSIVRNENFFSTSTSRKDAAAVHANLLSKVAIPFKILGLSLHPLNGQYLAIYGAQDLQVLVLSNGSITKQILPQLMLDAFDPPLNIVSVQWHPSATTCICVVTSSFVKIYDLGSDVYSPIHNYVLHDGEICSAAFAADHLESSRLEVIVMSSKGILHHCTTLDHDCDNGPVVLSATLPISNDLEGKTGSIYFSNILNCLFITRGSSYLLYAWTPDGQSNCINLSKMAHSRSDHIQWIESIEYPGVVLGVFTQHVVLCHISLTERKFYYQQFSASNVETAFFCSLQATDNKNKSKVNFCIVHQDGGITPYSSSSAHSFTAPCELSAMGKAALQKMKLVSITNDEKRKCESSDQDIDSTRFAHSESPQVPLGIENLHPSDEYNCAKAICSLEFHPTTINGLLRYLGRTPPVSRISSLPVADSEQITFHCNRNQASYADALQNLLNEDAAETFNVTAASNGEVFMFTITLRDLPQEGIAGIRVCLTCEEGVSTGLPPRLEAGLSTQQLLYEQNKWYTLPFRPEAVEDEVSITIYSESANVMIHSLVVHVVKKEALQADMFLTSMSLHLTNPVSLVFPSPVKVPFLRPFGPETLPSPSSCDDLVQFDPSDCEVPIASARKVATDAVVNGVNGEKIAELSAAILLRILGADMGLVNHSGNEVVMQGLLTTLSPRHTIANACLNANLVLQHGVKGSEVLMSTAKLHEFAEGLRSGNISPSSLQSFSRLYLQHPIEVRDYFSSPAGEPLIEHLVKSTLYKEDTADWKDDNLPFIFMGILVQTSICSTTAIRIFADLFTHPRDEIRHLAILYLQSLLYTPSPLGLLYVQQQKETFLHEYIELEGITQEQRLTHSYRLLEYLGDVFIKAKGEPTVKSHVMASVVCGMYHCICSTSSDRDSSRWEQNIGERISSILRVYAEGGLWSCILLDEFSTRLSDYATLVLMLCAALLSCDIAGGVISTLRGGPLGRAWACKSPDAMTDSTGSTPTARRTDPESEAGWQRYDFIFNVMKPYIFSSTYLGDLGNLLCNLRVAMARFADSPNGGIGGRGEAVDDGLLKDSSSQSSSGMTHWLVPFFNKFSSNVMKTCNREIAISSLQLLFIYSCREPSAVAREYWVDILSAWKKEKGLSAYKTEVKLVSIAMCGGAEQLHTIQDAKKYSAEWKIILERVTARKSDTNAWDSIRDALNGISSRADKRPHNWARFVRENKGSTESLLSFGINDSMSLLNVLSLVTYVAEDRSDLDFSAYFANQVMGAQRRALLERALLTGQSVKQTGALMVKFLLTAFQLLSQEFREGILKEVGDIILCSVEYGPRVQYVVECLIKLLTWKDDSQMVEETNNTSKSLPWYSNVNAQLCDSFTSALVHSNSVLLSHPNSDLYELLNVLCANLQFCLERGVCPSSSSEGSAQYTDSVLSKISAEIKFGSQVVYSRLQNTVSIQRIEMILSDLKATRQPKEIEVYYSTKEANDVNELRNKDFQWRHAGVMHIEKNSSRATLVLSNPFTCANLKLLYSKFHEDTLLISTEVLQCPSCNQPITNKRGQCVFCEFENFFQCRQCRNINHENLDSFLCNECGFSRYGRFEFAFSWTAASGIESIQSDEERARALAILLTETEKLRGIVYNTEVNRNIILEMLALWRMPGLVVSKSRSERTSITAAVASFSQECLQSCVQLAKVGRGLVVTRNELQRYLGSRDDGSDNDDVMDVDDEVSFSCYVYYTNQLLRVLTVLSSNPPSSAPSCYPRLLEELWICNLHRGSPDARLKAREVIKAITKSNRQLTTTILSHLWKKAEACLAYSSSLDIPSSLHGEMSLLSDLCDIQDEFKNLRLALALRVLDMSSTSKGAGALCIQTVALPCVRILCRSIEKSVVVSQAFLGMAAVRQPEQGSSTIITPHVIKFCGSLYSRLSSLYNYSILPPALPQTSLSGRVGKKRACSDTFGDPNKRSKLVPEVACVEAMPEHCNGAAATKKRPLSPSSTNTTPKKGRVEWIFKKGEDRNGDWLAFLLLHPFSESIRSDSSVLLVGLAQRDFAFRRTLACALLQLATTEKIGVFAHQELFNTLFDIIINSPDLRCTLVLRGAFTTICERMLVEAKGILQLDQSPSTHQAKCHLAFNHANFLSNLLRLLLVLLQSPLSDVNRAASPLACPSSPKQFTGSGYTLGVKNTPYSQNNLVTIVPTTMTTMMRYIKRQNRTLDGLYDLYLSLRSIAQQTAVTSDCTSALKSLIGVMVGETESDKRAFIRAWAMSIGRSHQSPLAKHFSVEQVVALIQPPQEIIDYPVLIKKKPSQEEFVRGQMSKLPYKASEIGLLMKDVVSKICRDLELYVDSDFGIELLVDGKIVSNNLPIALVYERVWKKSNSYINGGGKLVPMLVIFRLQGLDGEATEEIIQNLEESQEAPENLEEKYKLLDEFSDREIAQSVLNGVLHSSSAGLRHLDIATEKSTVLGVMKLLSFGVHIASVRRTLAQLNAIHVLLHAMKFILSTSTEARGRSPIIRARNAPASETDIIFHIASQIAQEESVSESVVDMSDGDLSPSQEEGESLLHIEMCLQQLSLGGDKNMKTVSPLLPCLIKGSHATAKRLLSEMWGYLPASVGGAQTELSATTLFWFQSVILMFESLHNASRSSLCLRESAVSLHLLAPCLEFLNASHNNPSQELVLYKLTFSLLIAICRGCSKAAKEVISKGYLPLLHTIELDTQDARHAELAATLLDEIKSVPDSTCSDAVDILREATLQSKRLRAQQQRDIVLNQLNFSVKGGCMVDINDKFKLDDLEDEPGVKCVVCQEGLQFQPDQILGLYTYSKPIEVLGISAASVAPSHSPSVNKSATSLSAISTVCHFNAIHLTCHETAVSADSRSKPPKPEWEGAAIRNMQTKCNNILPIRSPEVPIDTYASYVSHYFDRLSSIQPTSFTNFEIVMYDICQLLKRFAKKTSFSVDSNGGGPAHNINFLAYLLQLGSYVIDTDGQNNRAVFEKLFQRLTGLDVTNGSGETADLLLVLTLLLLSKEEWANYKYPILQQYLRMSLRGKQENIIHLLTMACIVNEINETLKRSCAVCSLSSPTLPPGTSPKLHAVSSPTLSPQCIPIRISHPPNEQWIRDISTYLCSPSEQLSQDFEAILEKITVWQSCTSPSGLLEVYGVLPQLQAEHDNVDIFISKMKGSAPVGLRI